MATPFKYKKSWLMVSAVIGISGPTAFAQESQQKEETSGLEIIEVTAQRKVENLQETPVSVQAISPTELTRRNVTDVYQMTLNAPSLQFGQDNTMSIRGAGTLAFSNALDSSVAVAVDDINLGRRFLMGPVFNDIYQIEVVNGPQGLLYGKNASAGLVNIRTTRPDTGFDEGKIDVEYILRDTTPNDSASIITRGTFNKTLSDTSAIRVNAHYSSEDAVTERVNELQPGQRFDETTKDYGAKVKYLNELSEDLSIYVIADINEEEGAAGNFDQTFRSIADGSSKEALLAADGVTAGNENLQYAADGEQYRDVKLGGTQATVTYALSDSLELSNIIGWRFFELEQNFDSDFTTTNDLSKNYNTTDYDQFSNELRLSITGNDYQGQVGLYYFFSEFDQNTQMEGQGGLPAFLLPNFPFCVGAEVAPGGPPNCSVSNDNFVGSDRKSTMTTESSAIFGQFDYNLTDKLTLTTGLRYTYDDISIDIANFQEKNFFISIGAPALRSEEETADNISGKVALRYQFSTNNIAFASYSRGYKGPGYADTPAPGQDDIFIDPETVDSYEAGVKTMWLDNRLIVNATGFLSEFKDYQVQAFDASLGQAVTQNAAELTSKGLELSVSAMPMDDLSVNVSSTYIDAKFDSFPGAGCYPQQPECDANGTFDASGEPSPTAAKVTTSASMTYNFDVSQNAYGFATLSYYHRDSINPVVGRPSETQIPSIDQFGFNLGIIFDNGWSATLYCKNCTDNKRPNFVSLEGSDAALNNLRTAVQTWGFNSVRNIGVRVAYEF